jgi:hypothetical protein
MRKRLGICGALSDLCRFAALAIASSSAFRSLKLIRLIVAPEAPKVSAPMAGGGPWTAILRTVDAILLHSSAPTAVVAAIMAIVLFWMFGPAPPTQIAGVVGVRDEPPAEMQTAPSGHGE